MDSAHSLTVRHVLDFLGQSGLKVLGPDHLACDSVAPLSSAQRGQLTFLRNGHLDGIRLISECQASTIICGEEFLDLCNAIPDKTLIVVANPRLEFVRVVQHFFAPKPMVGIHPTAIVDPNASIAKDAYIGPYCVLEKCTIGEGSQVLGHNYIFRDTRIGSNVVIKPGAVIGAEGFGFAADSSGKWQKFRHLGGVVLEDDVEVGANSCVDRGTLANTLIKQGTKIDNQVHIGHNVEIGKDCFITTGSRIGGSTVIEDNIWLSPGSVINDGLRIGTRSWIGIGAVVSRSVPSGSRVIPIPPKILAQSDGEAK